MYKKVDANLNFVDREKQIEKFWNDNDIFKKSMEHRKEGETYTFYDGPPTANGKPHIGHVETRTIKDMIPRYQTMKGKFVPRKAGWDTHGLPVELEVEKLLGLNGKEQIEEYGMEPFIKKCKESVWKYKGMWEDFSKTVGFWADMDNPYVTYDDNFIESEWWALKEIWTQNVKNQLLPVGITVTDDGTLSFDETAVSSDNIENVKNLFGSSSSYGTIIKGYAEKLFSSLVQADSSDLNIDYYA